MARKAFAQQQTSLCPHPKPKLLSWGTPDPENCSFHCRTASFSMSAANNDSCTTVHPRTQAVPEAPCSTNIGKSSLCTMPDRRSVRDYRDQGSMRRTKVSRCVRSAMAGRVMFLRYRKPLEARPVCKCSYPLVNQALCLRSVHFSGTLLLSLDMIGSADYAHEPRCTGGL